MNRSNPPRAKKAGTSDPAKPSFQVIVLGPTGGPREDKVTGILVRSTSLNWSPGSVIAVDAGTLLAGIIRSLKTQIPTTKNGQGVVTKGPFKGLELPYETAEANAAHVFREVIGAVFITHPHLDHISGLAINTPILEAGNGPKPVAALPSVLAAIKNHMFNDVIWPNLSDEDGGAGLLTYQRLVEGGNPRFGSGEGRGYVRACNGLLAKCLSVSHGKCKQRYHHETGVHHRAASTVFATEPWMLPARQLSVEHVEGGFCSPARSPHLGLAPPNQPVMAAVESSAFFLRDHSSGDEIIVFGDVEPDSVSLEPRNRRVWETAAPKIAANTLRGIFIECSYTDSVDDAYLYGHLCPRHLVAELTVLADKVMDAREELPQADRKRKLGSASYSEPPSAEVSPRSKRLQPSSNERNRKSATSEPRSQPNSVDYSNAHVAFGESAGMEVFEAPDPQRWANSDRLPLSGLAVYIIHIKETLTDGPPPGERILRELEEHSKTASLGCKFFLPDPEEAIWI